MRKPTATIAFRVPTELRDKLERQAAARNETLGELMRHIVTEYLDEEKGEALKDQLEIVCEELHDQRADMAEGFRMLGKVLGRSKDASPEAWKQLCDTFSEQAISKLKRF